MRLPALIISALLSGAVEAGGLGCATPPMGASVVSRRVLLARCTSTPVCLGALTLPATAATKSRTELLRYVANVLRARDKLESVQASMRRNPGAARERARASVASKSLFKDLELERNLRGAVDYLPDGPARAAGIDAMEFAASIVTFDGFATMDDPINERLLERETTPDKLLYVQRAVDRSLTCFDTFIGGFDVEVVRQARQLLDEL